LVEIDFYGHSHSQPFVLTYPEADLAYYFELTIILGAMIASKGTACLTAAWESNCHSLPYEKASDR